jgi:hypothetical protein
MIPSAQEPRRGKSQKNLRVQVEFLYFLVLKDHEARNFLLPYFFHSQQRYGMITDQMERVKVVNQRTKGRKQQKEFDDSE